MTLSHIQLPRVSHAVDSVRANFITALKRPLEKQQIFVFLAMELLELSLILCLS